MEIAYGLELNRIAEEVKKLSEGRKTEDRRPINICLQFPDGLKANATEVVRELERKTKDNGMKTKDQRPKTMFFIWAGSNFGGCDYPWYLKDLGFDLLVNFGHSVFKKQ